MSWLCFSEYIWTEQVFFLNHPHPFYIVHLSICDSSSESGQLDFFLMVGRAPADIFAQYAALTGRGRLPQMFAIAYHQVRRVECGRGFGFGFEVGWVRNGGEGRYWHGRVI